MAVYFVKCLNNRQTNPLRNFWFDSHLSFVVMLCIVFLFIIFILIKSFPKFSDENIFNPVWKNQVFVFRISCPDLAFLRFEVGNEVNASSYISQATFPVKSLRPGLFLCILLL